MTEQELAAAKINAMINGLDPEEVTNNMLVEAEQEKEKAKRQEKAQKKKEKASKSSKSSKKKEEAPEFVSEPAEVPELKFFSKLAKTIPMQVTFGEHDIPYKEQLWAIPTRTVDYKLELVSSKKLARDISDKVNGESEQHRERANKGTTRYYRLITHENVLHKVKEIGYVKVYRNSDNIKYSIAVKNNLLKENNVNVDKLKDKMRDAMDNMLES